MEQTALALSALAQATPADRETVANVVTVNQTLASQLNRKISTLTSIQTRLMALETTGNNQAGQGGGGGGGGGGGRGAPRNNNANNESYCHSHGCTCRDNHVSGTYRKPVEGHITTATLHNRQGGSNRWCGDAA